jgi:hypothetical protein
VADRADQRGDGAHGDVRPRRGGRTSRGDEDGGKAQASEDEPDRRPEQAGGERDNPGDR